MLTNDNYTWRLLRFLSSICTLLTTTRMSTMIIGCRRQVPHYVLSRDDSGGWSRRSEEEGDLNLNEIFVSIKSCASGEHLTGISIVVI